MSLKNEDLFSHKQLIPGDVISWKRKKQTNTKESLYGESSNKTTASDNQKRVAQDYSWRDKHLLGGTDTKGIMLQRIYYSEVKRFPLEI